MSRRRSCGPCNGPIVFERPAVIDYPRQALAAQGLTGRCEFIEGDFLTEVPPGADVYLLKSVIHNWREAEALRILGNCRAAMAGRGRLLLIERVVDTEDRAEAAIRDMSMLVLFASHDRAPAEYRALVEQAGFAVRRTSVSPSGLCAIEAVPAPSVAEAA